LLPHKGHKYAIQLAKKLGFKLVVAGEDKLNVDVTYVNYIKELCKKANVEYLGSVPNATKLELLSRVKAVLLPFLRAEAFSLIAIEAMASGTPVITSNLGALPEIVVHGKTGFLCNSIFDFVEAIKRVDEINPKDCVKHVEEHFSIERGAEAYGDLYHIALKGEGW